MTVLYFSSTGNCLYVAKRIGGRLLSIPECIHEENFEIEDTEVGLVFPVYGLCVPPFIVEFIEKTSITTTYLFAVATYGFFPGAVCGQLSITEKRSVILGEFIYEFSTIAVIRIRSFCKGKRDILTEESEKDYQSS